MGAPPREATRIVPGHGWTGVRFSLVRCRWASGEGFGCAGGVPSPEVAGEYRTKWEPMRQVQQNRRGRGRGRKNQNPLTRSYESNGPDVKIRGTAAHIAEKYGALARDALASGDTVTAENYFQHAEHYNRIIMAVQAQMQQPDMVNGSAQRMRKALGERPGNGERSASGERAHAGDDPGRVAGEAAPQDREGRPRERDTAETDAAPREGRREERTERAEQAASRRGASASGDGTRTRRRRPRPAAGNGSARAKSSQGRSRAGDAAPAAPKDADAVAGNGGGKDTVDTAPEETPSGDGVT